MRSLPQKILVIIISLGLGGLGYFIKAENDYLWSIKSVIIPVLIAILALYTTLSMSLVKSLDELPNQFREKAMAVLDSMKYELKLELVILLITFVSLVVYPFLESSEKTSLYGRCIIDVFIVFDIVNFVIAILDTFFWYLKLIKAK